MRTIFTTAAGLAVITASGSTQGQQTLDTIDPASIEARGGGFISVQGSSTVSGGSAAGHRKGQEDIKTSLGSHYGTAFADVEEYGAQSLRKGQQGQQTLDTIDPASIEARGGGFLSTQGSFTLSGGSHAGADKEQIQDSMSFVERTSAEKTHAENQRKKMGLRKGQQMDTIVKGRGGGFLATTGSFTLSGGAAGQRWALESQHNMMLFPHCVLCTVGTYVHIGINKFQEQLLLNQNKSLAYSTYCSSQKSWTNLFWCFSPPRKKLLLPLIAQGPNKIPR